MTPMPNCLAQLADNKFRNTTAPLQKNILAFYADPAAPIETKKDPERWQKVQTDIDALRAFAPDPSSPQSQVAGKQVAGAEQ